MRTLKMKETKEQLVAASRKEAEAHIKFGAVKDELIAARQNVDKGNLRGAILHMKWAVEKLLPEGQQYCSQTLEDADPDKTIQGYLDNIVAAVRLSRDQG